jgi:hypothetical protein
MGGSYENGGTHPLGPPRGPTITSRPLMPGKTFTLVVQRPKVDRMLPDRQAYAPGQTCRLAVHGKNLTPESVEVLVDMEEERRWVPVKKLKPEVDASRTTATAEFTFPIPPGHAEAVAALQGALTSAVWTAHEVREGSPLVAQVEARGMDGQQVVVYVEAEQPDGSWRYVAHVESKLEAGRCEASWTPPAPAGSAGDPAGQGGAASNKGNLAACRFEDGAELGSADTAWIQAKCPGFEGQHVQFVLEREGDGGWAEVSTAAATVKVGEARTGMLLDV